MYLGKLSVYIRARRGYLSMYTFADIAAMYTFADIAAMSPFGADLLCRSCASSRPTITRTWRRALPVFSPDLAYVASAAAVAAPRPPRSYTISMQGWFGWYRYARK